MIDFENGLFGALRQDAGPIWQAYIHHDFVEKLGQGSLPQHCFKHFLLQDYLFLVHFARAYALLAAKSDTLIDIKDALCGLQAIVDELPLHVRYCASWGITEEDLQQLEEAPQTIAYTRYVMDIGHKGDRLDLMAALMPCVAGYAEIGLYLAKAKTTKWQDNPYADWIRSYESADYQKGVVAGIDLINRLGKILGAENRFAALSVIFKTATRLETDFWQMGLDA